VSGEPPDRWSIATDVSRCRRGSSRGSDQPGRGFVPGAAAGARWPHRRPSALRGNFLIPRPLRPHSFELCRLDLAVHRLESVANVRQCPAHDDAHGLVRALHLDLEQYRLLPVGSPTTPASQRKARNGARPAGHADGRHDMHHHARVTTTRDRQPLVEPDESLTGAPTQGESPRNPRHRPSRG